MAVVTDPNHLSVQQAMFFGPVKISAYAIAPNQAVPYKSGMSATILKAHYDGVHIVLDEPFELAPNAALVITVLNKEAERTEWTTLGAQNMARAYSDDEPEYTTADLKT